MSLHGVFVIKTVTVISVVRFHYHPAPAPPTTPGDNHQPSSSFGTGRGPKGRSVLDHLNAEGGQEVAGPFHSPGWAAVVAEGVSGDTHLALASKFGLGLAKKAATALA